jgi:hypothetical protein
VALSVRKGPHLLNLTLRQTPGDEGKPVSISIASQCGLTGHPSASIEDLQDFAVFAPDLRAGVENAKGHACVVHSICPVCYWIEQ